MKLNLAYRFRENTIAGDDGFYVRNDVRIKLSPKIPILSKTYLNIFYDYGYVRDKYKDSDDIAYNSSDGYLSGVGIGLSYYGDYLTMSLTYSKALHSPQYLWTRDGMEREAESVYWKIGVGWRWSETLHPSVSIHLIIQNFIYP
jgi:hypothetical protein